MVSYALCIVMVLATLSFRSFLIDKEFSLVEFHPVDEHTDGRLEASMNRNHTVQVGNVLPESSAALALSSSARKTIMKLIRSTIHLKFTLLVTYFFRGFEVVTKDKFK